MPRSRIRTRERRAPAANDLFPAEADLLHYERSARARGAVRIAGLDEAGRGPLAGPVVAAAVVLPEGLVIPGVNDSKQLSAERRDRLFDLIVESASAYGIGIVGARTIDRVNILQATIIAMERALAGIIPPPDFLLIDALSLPRVSLPQEAIIKGDCRSHSIAAASILAKVSRDRLMADLHERFPQYHFQKHKGYGTKEHLNLLRLHGPCEEHRRSFRPVAQVLQERAP